MAEQTPKPEEDRGPKTTDGAAEPLADNDLDTISAAQGGSSKGGHISKWLPKSPSGRGSWSI